MDNRGYVNILHYDKCYDRTEIKCLDNGGVWIIEVRKIKVALYAILLPAVSSELLNSSSVAICRVLANGSSLLITEYRIGFLLTRSPLWAWLCQLLVSRDAPLHLVEIS